MNRLINTKYILTSTAITLIAFTFLLANKVNAEESVSQTTENSSSVKIISKPPIPGTIQEKIRAGVDNRLQNVKNNQETREDMVKNGKLPTTALPKIMKDDPRFASTSKMRIEDRERFASTTQKLIRDQRLSSTSPRINERFEKDNRASTTRMFLRKDGYENEGKAMVEKILKEKKDNLTKQLEVAIKNLTDLRKRISTRIEKDRLAGKDLSSVSELLKIADTKLALARDAVKAVQNYTPSTKDQLASTTSTQTDPSTRVINLEQIRNLVEKSRIAIKDAHKALNDVVVAIAKLNGNNLPRETNSVPSMNVSSSSTNQ